MKETYFCMVAHICASQAKTGEHGKSDLGFHIQMQYIFFFLSCSALQFNLVTALSKVCISK
jgi:hypothetical protein